MTSKHLLALSAAALAVVLAVLYTEIADEQPPTLAGQRLYPDLEARVNDVTGLHLELGAGLGLDIARGETSTLR